MSDVKFSILVPAYKQMYLADCIESILAQTYQGWELIIVNDASPYDIDKIVSNYKDDRIRYYKNEVGCGAENVVDNWNICLSYVRGDYIICMGDDDCLLPHCLEEYNSLINKYPNLDVYHTRTELIDESGTIIGLQEARPEWESAYSALWHLCSCHRIQYIGDFLFRTSSLKKENGFYKLPLAIFSDNITSIRAAKKMGIANTLKFCFQYRVNKHTISNNGQPKILADSIKAAYDWFLEFLHDCPHDEDDKNYRTLLLEKDLHNHMYDMMMYVIEKDLEKEGLSAIHYWSSHCKELGVAEDTMKLRMNSFRKRFYKSKMKMILRIHGKTFL